MSAAMGLQPVPAPNTRNRHVGGLEFRRQSSTTPMRAPVFRATAGPFQNACFEAGRGLTGRAPLVQRCQTAQSTRPKTRTPSLNIGGAAPQRSGRAANSFTTRHQQNNLRTTDVLGSQCSRAHPALQFPTFWWSKNQAFGRHEVISAENVANINVTLH
jgi:hypothetical protein